MLTDFSSVSIPEGVVNKMNIAIMGYGVVGSGVAEVIAENNSKIVKKSNQESIEIKYILDLRKFPGDPFENLVTDDFNKILEDKTVEIVVETMGGVKPAYDFVLACLNAGKSVVTSNKELVAEKGLELLRAAKANNCHFMFEASVGGGIPVIRPINRCLAANEIEEVAGILNGTTNFILTMMIEQGMTFEDALALAQKNGYAERDPSADILGHDACRKISILAALCFGRHVYPKDVFTQGITEITLEDVEYVESYNAVIKLLGRAKRLDDGRISAMVSPAVVKNSCMLAGVKDVFNAVLVRGNAVGDVLFYGRGAGKRPTASAVVADVIDCASKKGTAPVFDWDEAKEGYIADYLDAPTALYIRFKAADKQAALEAARREFGEITVLERKNAPADEGAFVTGTDTERRLNEKLAAAGLNALSIIRVTDY